MKYKEIDGVRYFEGNWRKPQWRGSIVVAIVVALIVYLALI